MKRKKRKNNIILKFGRKNKNNNIYYYHEVTLPNIVPILGELDHPRDNMKLEDLGVAGIADLNMNRKNIQLNLESSTIFKDKESGKLLEKLLIEDMCVFRTAGSGSVDENGNITDYRLKYIFFCPKDMAA